MLSEKSDKDRNFFRDYARKKWPLRGSCQNQSLNYNCLTGDKVEITNYKHQISNKIKNQVFGILNFGLCDLPFDLAQGGGELVEPFVI
jgi:hypothetical protein